jgi:carboxyl-terminal processing protease
VSTPRPLILVVAFVASWLAACNSPSSSPEAPAKRTADLSEGGALPELAGEGDPREPVLAQTIAEILETQHLRDRRLDEELSREAFAAYLERIDPGKMFLLKEHVAALRPYEERMTDMLRSGELALAHRVTALMAQRRAAVLEIIEAHLEEPFDFAVEEFFELDPDRREFSTSEEELAERWRLMLKLQVLERVDRMETLAEALAADDDIEDSRDIGTTLADIPDTFEEREAKARRELLSQYQGRFERMSDLTPLEPAQLFVNAIATSFDPHTVYMPPMDRENFDLNMSGQFEGIGAVLQEDDHYIRVTEVVPGGAAWRQGDLEEGDLILAVAQEGEEPVDVADMRLDRAVQMIRGPKDTTVILTVRKPDDRVMAISITRDVVQIEAAYARGALLDLGEDHEAMGYIRLPSFYGNTRPRPGQAQERRSSEDVKRLLQMFEARGTRGVIIDLRRNGGGLLEHARDITGMFIKGGPVVKTRTSTGDTQVLADQDPNVAYRGEVIVLVDRFSASASEIVAGALQDYERALIVGTSPTHGKGTVQMMLDLDRVRRSPDGELGALKLTIQQFFRVSGESTQARGVVPDVLLPDPTAHIESGERYLDNAIPFSAVDPLPHARWPRSWNPEALAAQSMTRQRDREVFTRIRAYSAQLKARSERTRVPLARQAWQAQRTQDRLMIESVDPQISEGPARFAVEVVNYADERPVAPRGGADPEEVRRARERSWTDELSKDPWVEEALYVLADMTARTR